MGVWGTAIFSDDTACDIRGIYKELLGDGLSPSDATDRILIEWKDSFDDPYEGSAIWLALAVTQWNLGRLEERVKDKAIDIISSGSELDRWEGKDREKRKKVLEKTKAQLESPQPEAKKTRKTFKDHCDWKVGELVAYSTLSKDKIIFRVIGFHEDRGGKAPICELLDWKGKELPGKMKLRFLGIRKREYPHGNNTIAQFLIGRTSEKELPKNRVKRMGILLKPLQKPGGYRVVLWRYLDKQLKDLFDIE